MIQNKQCRVCGKDYEPCRTHAPRNGVFRWREVACSPECGAIYLNMIQTSRSNIVNAETDEFGTVDGSEIKTDTLDSKRD